jgi:hypothetical protein
MILVERIVSRETIILVERIGIGTSHVVLVFQPDVISLLSSKDSECSAYDHSGNNDCGQNSSGDTDSSSGRDVKAGLAITITHSARVHSGSWDLFEITSGSVRAEGNVTISDEIGKGRIFRTILLFILASQDTVATLSGAWVVIIAGDVVVLASSKTGHAGVVGTDIEVVTIDRGVVWRVSASSGGVAEIVSATISVGAVDQNISALSSAVIAELGTAKIVVVAVERNEDITFAIGVVALSGHTRSLRADCGLALASSDGSVSASSGRGAGVSGAGVIVIARIGRVLASNVGIAQVKSAWVRVIAADVDVLASNKGNAGISCALVVVVARSGSVLATVSVLSSNALVISARIIIVAVVGADASGTTRAESETSRSARIAWNINASGNDEAVENSRQLRIVNHEEGSLDSNNAGGDEVNLRWDRISDSNTKEEDSKSLS